jgi:hypothetical protein
LEQLPFCLSEKERNKVIQVAGDQITGALSTRHRGLAFTPYALDNLCKAFALESGVTTKTVDSGFEGKRQSHGEELEGS